MKLPLKASARMKWALEELDIPEGPDNNRPLLKPRVQLAKIVLNHRQERSQFRASCPLVPATCNVLGPGLLG
jgi:hypothetical protein